MDLDSCQELCELFLEDSENQSAIQSDSSLALVLQYCDLEQCKHICKCLQEIINVLAKSRYHLTKTLNLLNPEKCNILCNFLDDNSLTDPNDVWGVLTGLSGPFKASILYHKRKDQLIKKIKSHYPLGFLLSVLTVDDGSDLLDSLSSTPVDTSDDTENPTPKLVSIIPDRLTFLFLYKGLLPEKKGILFRSMTPFFQNIVKDYNDLILIHDRLNFEQNLIFFQEIVKDEETFNTLFKSMAKLIKFFSKKINATLLTTIYQASQPYIHFKLESANLRELIDFLVALQKHLGPIEIADTIEILKGQIISEITDISKLGEATDAFNCRGYGQYFDIHIKRKLPMLVMKDEGHQGYSSMFKQPSSTAQGTEVACKLI